MHALKPGRDVAQELHWGIVGILLGGAAKRDQCFVKQEYVGLGACKFFAHPWLTVDVVNGERLCLIENPIPDDVDN